MPNKPPTEDAASRITCRPGTDEYERQFYRQALRAADAAIRLWIVRIPCGVFAVLLVLFIVDGWREASMSIADLLLFAIWLPLMAIELANVALRGKSFSIRYGLSGAKSARVKLDDRDDAE